MMPRRRTGTGHPRMVVMIRGRTVKRKRSMTLKGAGARLGIRMEVFGMRSVLCVIFHVLSLVIFFLISCLPVFLASWTRFRSLLSICCSVAILVLAVLFSMLLLLPLLRVTLMTTLGIYSSAFLAIKTARCASFLVSWCSLTSELSWVDPWWSARLY